MEKLSNKPYKGTNDWLPDEFAVRKAIFDRWRKICNSYGYGEYLTPLVEPVEIYKAKSGEDVGGKELMELTDRAGRVVAIRPEMTPSVTRLVTQIYESTPKPIRLFSIANFMRAEKPQRGRNREFWQLNFDIFGSDSILADVEIIQMSIDIMLSFNPPKDSFTVNINHRGLINEFLQQTLSIPKEKLVEVTRLMDKYEKLGGDDFYAATKAILGDENCAKQIEEFMLMDRVDSLISKYPNLEDSTSIKELREIQENLKVNNYETYVKFKPNLIRGFDYYDGMVLEVFDNHPKNNRALFGGGRYNSLAELFGSDDIPAVGVAPGDETLRLFIESWDLLDGIIPKSEKRVYIPMLNSEFTPQIDIARRQLQKEGYVTVVGLEESKIGKAFTYADKNNFSHIALIGEKEVSENGFNMKDLSNGEEKLIPFS